MNSHEYLSTWLALRQFDISLQAMIPTVSPTCADEYDKTFFVGQIRKVASELIPTATGERYIVVVGEWDDGLFLVIPFSRYPVPAVVGELITERTDSKFGTLSVWNAILAPAAVLSKGWDVGTCTTAEINDANAVFRHIASGAPLLKHLHNRVGAPILTTTDPRISYQDEETKMFAQFRSLCAVD